MLYNLYYINQNYDYIEHFIQKNFTSFEDFNLQQFNKPFLSNNKLLSYVNLPNCTSIISYCFCDCIALENVNLPNCSIIGNYAFYNCSNLSEINLSNCSIIGSSVFYNCVNLREINLSNCSIIGSYAFCNCSNLSEINLPNCSVIGNGAFRSCSYFSEINLPECTTIGAAVFWDNRTYQNGVSTIIRIPKCISLNERAFTIGYITTNYLQIYLSGSQVISLSAQLYMGEYFRGKIYVPSILLSNYKANSYWNIYASQIEGY